MSIKGTVAALLMTVCLAKNGIVSDNPVHKASADKFKTNQVVSVYLLDSEKNDKEEKDEEC